MSAPLPGGLMSDPQPELFAAPGEQAPEKFDRPHRVRLPFPAGALQLDTVPLPLPGRDRITWRITAVLLSLAACRGRSATVEQLHVLSWAVRGERNADALLAAWEQRPGASRSLRAWDPGLDDTLKLARASGLITQLGNGRQKLSEPGERVVAAIQDNSGAMGRELQLLGRLGRLTESGMWERLGRRPRRAR
jgi:hypothetical protein